MGSQPHLFPCSRTDHVPGKQAREKRCSLPVHRQAYSVDGQVCVYGPCTQAPVTTLHICCIAHTLWPLFQPLNKTMAIDAINPNADRASVAKWIFTIDVCIQCSFILQKFIEHLL